MLLPSVDDVFARSENRSALVPYPLSPGKVLFSKSLMDLQSRGVSGDESQRVASVSPQDIPVVLRMLSEMSVFSSAKERQVRPGSDCEVDNMLLRDPDNAAVVYDVDALRAAFAAVRDAFPPHWIHCMAIKSCPLAFVIQELLEAGLGVEAASFVELYMALAHGCSPSLAVFDSPAKTAEELEMALRSGTLVNANSLDELDRIDAILQSLSRDSGCGVQAGGNGLHVRSSSFDTGTVRVGIRLNPLVGAGTFSELSTSVPNSKFGVPVTPQNIAVVIDAFRRWPWMVALHTHVGSQGFSLEKLAEGVATLCDVADEVDEALGKGRVKLLDIGGGLPANYKSDEVTPTFHDYAAVLRRKAPKLFTNGERTVVTEFGRSLVAKTAITVSTIEYVRQNVEQATAGVDATVHLAAPNALTSSTTETDDTCSADEKNGTSTPTTEGEDEGEQPRPPTSAGHQTLVTHVGADLFLRTSYCPRHYAHRLSVYNRNGEALPGPAITTEVAGPLCFEGDYVARDSKLPRAAAGDLIVAHDTGANTISLFSRHCSRRAPAVYGYAVGLDGQLTVRLIKKKESVRDVAKFWGAR